MAIPNEYLNRHTPYVLGRSAVAVSCPADTTEDILATITVPANSMGANGMLRITTLWSFTNSANLKTMRVRFGGASGTQYVLLSFNTALTASYSQILIGNRNATDSQVGPMAGSTSFSTNANSPITSSVDTTAETSIVLSGQKASSGETITLEMYLVELIYGA